jgi:hypothetical protein
MEDLTSRNAHRVDLSQDLRLLKCYHPLPRLIEFF